MIVVKKSAAMNVANRSRSSAAGYYVNKLERGPSKKTWSKLMLERASLARGSRHDLGNKARYTPAASLIVGWTLKETAE